MRAMPSDKTSSEQIVSLVLHDLGISYRRRPVFSTHLKHKNVNDLLRICQTHYIPYERTGKRGGPLRKDLEKGILRYINTHHPCRNVGDIGPYARDETAQSTTALTRVFNREIHGYPDGMHRSSSSSAVDTSKPDQASHLEVSCRTNTLHLQVELYRSQHEFVPIISYEIVCNRDAVLDLQELATAMGIGAKCLVLDPVYRRPFATCKPGFVTPNELSRLVEHQSLSIIGAVMQI
ncbi:hypothetical protein NM688_g4586 [Phlebia brevispora]|uniref:Uncharacterized protein n=1 Tax=Phlebia brevispora TaxID=194682 RepID=A0ACC1T2N0_9APHY|nr:hypothetical protein NM688_g4586 [Phlebia brevispora]